MRTTSRALTILFLGLGFSVTALGATYSYRLTEIPLNQFPEDVGEGRGISNAGHVTGIERRCISADSCGYSAFLWTGTKISYFDFFPSSPDGEQNWGEDINDLGQVAGYFNNSGAGGDLQSVFFWDGATKKLLGALGGRYSSGGAINKFGHITGYAQFAADNSNGHAFLWDGVTMRDLGTLGGTNSVGTGINAAGHVTGISERADGQTRAFIWDGTVMKSLGTLGGSQSRAWDINSKDQVVGESTTASGAPRAFIWQNGLMEDLGALPCCATTRATFAVAINNSGQVVGNSGPPFLWENGTMRNLNNLIAASDPLKSGFTLAWVRDINNVGQIIGAAQDNSDEKMYRAFLISPTYKLSAFLKPTINSWRRGSTVRIAIAVLDDNSVRIPDQRAQALQTVACRVKVSATGAQTLPSTCMNYDATTNEFWFEWKLLGTGTGPATIDARVNYGAPGPLKVRKTKNITVTT